MGETVTPRCVERSRWGSMRTARRRIAWPLSMHSSMTVASGAAVASTTSRSSEASVSGSPSNRRPAGLRDMIRRSPPTTSKPEVRLAMISSLSRSDASARATIACSRVRSFATASSMAAAINAVSAPASCWVRFNWRAAANNSSTTKASPAARAATTPVSESRMMDARDMSELGEVPRDERAAVEARNQRRHGQHRPERHSGGHIGTTAREQHDPDQPAHHRREHESQDDHLDAEPRADHREHLDVPKSHRFDFTQPVPQLGNRPEQSTPEQHAEERLQYSGRQHQAEHEPDDDSRKRDHVGQD